MNTKAESFCLNVFYWTVVHKGRELEVEELTADSFERVDIALFSAGGSIRYGIALSLFLHILLAMFFILSTYFKLLALQISLKNDRIHYLVLLAQSNRGLRLSLIYALNMWRWQTYF